MATVDGPGAKRAKTAAIGSREHFLEVYEDLRDELLENVQTYGLPAEATAWMRDMIEYNVPGASRGGCGEPIRGAATSTQEQQRRRSRPIPALRMLQLLSDFPLPRAQAASSTGG
jgi:hypothetical protein